MNLIETRAKCLEIKNNISWISSEFERVREKFIAEDNAAIQHCMFLCCQLSEIIAYIDCENLELRLSYPYCRLVDKLYKEIRTLIQSKSLSSFLEIKKDLSEPLLKV